MLGTFITEGDEGVKENDLLLDSIVDNKREKIKMSDYFYADKLVELCKYYKFDGWLMNFESKVNNVQKCIDWLKYFVKKMHDEIPGSIVVWYDSVIITDGSVRWQSHLNDMNKPFFDCCDLFFSDYKWNLEKLNASVQNSGTRL